MKLNSAGKSTICKSFMFLSLKSTTEALSSGRITFVNTISIKAGPAIF
jgi:hypothetical protein